MKSLSAEETRACSSPSAACTPAPCLAGPAKRTSHRYVARVQVWEGTVDGVGHRGARRATCLVAGAEHEVVDEQLSAAVEELRQLARALVGLEAVLLLEWDPGQLAALAC